jgi:hypothetical protein
MSLSPIAFICFKTSLLPLAPLLAMLPDRQSSARHVDRLCGTRGRCLQEWATEWYAACHEEYHGAGALQRGVRCAAETGRVRGEGAEESEGGASADARGRPRPRCIRQAGSGRRACRGERVPRGRPRCIRQAGSGRRACRGERVLRRARPRARAYARCRPDTISDAGGAWQGEEDAHMFFTLTVRGPSRKPHAFSSWRYLTSVRAKVVKAHTWQ